MSQLVTMLDDAYPYGCKGDVVTLENEDLEQLDAVGKVRKHEVYKRGAGAGEDAQEDAEEQEAEDAQVEKQGAKNAPNSDETPELSMDALRARARELELPANGSKEDLRARIAEAERRETTEV